MQEKNILLCFLAVPFRHKLIAAVIAVAIGSGFFVWSRRNVEAPATPAEVSFDAGLARQVEPTAMKASQPAVALAQSILTDEVVRGLADRVGLSGDVAEVRSRLEITQPSARLLDVNYREDDKELSTAAANAVANLLVAWRPSHAVIPPPVATAPVVPQPQMVPAVVITKKHRANRGARPEPVDIRNLEVQVVAIDQKLSALSAQQKADAAPRMPSPEEERRHLLEAQLNSAQKKLDTLRERYTDAYPDVEAAKENVADIQQQLALFPPVKHEAEKPTGPPKQDPLFTNEMSQLRVERARLVQSIAAEKRRGALQQGRGVPAGDSPEPVRTAASPSGQSLAHQLVGAAAGPILQSPFTLVQLATYSEPVLPWHGVLAGILCGLLYLSSALWRYLPMENGAAHASHQRLGLNNFSGAAVAANQNGVNDFPGIWEKEIREALALTDIGREEEALVAREEALARQRRANGNGAGPTGPLHYEEVSEAIQEKIKREPNSWMAHTEEARIALSSGDFDTAMKEIKLAITIAPEKLRPQLDKIITQLNKNLSMKQA